MAAEGPIAEPAPLPEYAGITEPMTVLTNLVLAVFALALSARLGYAAAADGKVAAFAMAGALMATAISALFGAVTHGVDPRTDAAVRKRFWRLALYATGLIGAATVASVAFFVVPRGAVRNAILIVAGVKLLAFWVAVTRRPEFRLAAGDNAGALAVLLAAAIYVWVRFDARAAPWLVAGILVSLVAGVIQARRVGVHRHFNHNDVFHVVQMVALYLFFRGGVLLVDR
jgi:hypothetical protein